MYADDAELTTLFDIDLVEGEHAPSYNQAPSELIRAVRSDAEAERLLTSQKWGFVPFWAKEGFKPLINARAETVTEKPVFSAAVKRRRCLVPANGYFEWQKTRDGKKQPYFLSLADSDGNPAPPGSEPVMAMAGIYEWPAGEGRKEEAGEAGKLEVPMPATVALLTRAASDTLGHIHDRMPVFVPRSLWGAWLDRDLTERDEVADVIASIPPAPLAPRMVAPAVGNVRNNFPGLIDPYDPDSGALFR